MDAMNEIESGLWVGGALPIAAAIFNQRLRTQDVRPDGIDVVVCLREEYCNVPAVNGLTASLWFSIPDAAPGPSVEWLEGVVSTIAAWRLASKTVLIHCAAGISRAPMVAAAHLMDWHGCSRDEALRRIVEKRPQIGPNTAFMELLLKYQAILGKPAMGG